MVEVADVGVTECRNASICDGWQTVHNKTAGPASQRTIVDKLDVNQDGTLMFEKITDKQEEHDLAGQAQAEQRMTGRAHLTVWLLEVTVAGMPSPEQEALLRLHQNLQNKTLSLSDIRAKSLLHIFADIGQESSHLELMTEKAQCSRAAQIVCEASDENDKMSVDSLKMQVLAKRSWPVPVITGSSDSDVAWNLLVESLSEWERHLKALETEVLQNGIVRDGSVLFPFYAESFKG